MFGLLVKKNNQYFTNFSFCQFQGITMWEVFSFGEKPYSEFKLNKPASVKKKLKEEKVMSKPKQYIKSEGGGDDDNYDQIETIYNNIIHP